MLSNYTEEKLTKAYKDYKAFFAFNDEQVAKGLAEHNAKKEDYCHIGMNLMCPKIHAKTLFETLNKIIADGVAQDIKDNGKEAIIERELINHEAYYVGDYSDTYEYLNSQGYEVDEDLIADVYRKTYNKNYNG